MLTHVPRYLSPAFRIGTPNRSIRLYRGPLELRGHGDSHAGNGVVQLDLVPSPRVTFRLSVDPTSGSLPDPNLAEAELSLPLTNTTVPVVVSHISIGRHVAVVGRLKERTSIGSCQGLRRVRFQLVNFHDYVGASVKSRAQVWPGRLVLQSSDWTVTVDTVPNLTGVNRALRDVGGFAVTHVGEVKRTKGESFTAAHARELIEALFWLLSFARGFSSSPVLPVGFDNRKRRVWQDWFAPRVTGWRGVDSWFDETQPTAISDVFPGFLQRWADPAWRDPLTMAIHWYLEANTVAGGVEGAIVLTQAALELLAWVLLVEQGKVFSALAFDRLPAEKRLDQLLDHVKIPAGLPFRLAATCTGLSGPGLIVTLRNALVHAKLKKRLTLQQFPFDVRVGAWTLGLWYLELILLWVLGFQGSYANRLTENRWAGCVDRVPWASP